MVVCAFDGCDKEFKPNSKKNQKYCSYECSVRANNKRAMEKYNERKRLLDSPKRKCATVGCPTILRKTNMDKYCDPCQNARREAEKKSFRELVLGE